MCVGSVEDNAGVFIIVFGFRLFYFFGGVCLGLILQPSHPPHPHFPPHLMLTHSQTHTHTQMLAVVVLHERN